jgi:hypothetical protein
VRFETLLEIANAKYPDDEIVQHWDAKRQEPVSPEFEGDTLALCIVRELHATSDACATDASQLETAVNVIGRAIVELDNVKVGLMAELLKRRHSPPPGGYSSV